MKYFFCILIASLIFTGKVKAQESNDPVKAELIVNTTSFVSGETFYAALKFSIKPGWHIYWKYPGESGLPTLAEFTTDPIITSSGELTYPVPNHFIQPGNLVGYGYEGQTVLLAPFKVTGSGQVGQVLKLVAKVRWLACGTVCLPGRAVLSQEKPLGSKTEPNQQEFFEKWLKTLPEKYDVNKADFKVNLNASSQAVLEWKIPVKQVDFIPLPPNGVVLQGLKTETTDLQTKLIFHWPSNIMPNSGLKGFKGLVLYQTSDYISRAVEVEF